MLKLLSAPMENITELLLEIERLLPHEKTSLFSRLNLSEEQFYSDIGRNMIVRDYERNLMDVETYRIQKELLLYIPPVLLLVGTIGNFLAFLVLRKFASKISTYSYLSVLALMDLLVLYVGLLRLWIGQLIGKDVKDESDLLCKLAIFLGYVCSDISVWLIIAVTIERYIAVSYPLKASAFCQVKRARIAILLPIGTISAINFHFFWTVELSEKNYENKKVAMQCDAAPEFAFLVNDVWPWVDAAIYSFVPMVIISVLNSLIVYKVCQANHEREYLLKEEQRNNRRKNKHNSAEASKKLTVMLLAVSFTFLITTLPMNIVVIATIFWNNSSSNQGLEEIGGFKLAMTVSKLLMYVNHSINFFLYCATGKKFRRQIIKVICGRCKPRYLDDKSGTQSFKLSRTRLSIKVQYFVTDRNDNTDSDRV